MIMSMKTEIYFKENHPNKAVSYNNMGIACYDLKNYQEALRYGKQALEMRIKIYEEIPN